MLINGPFVFLHFFNLRLWKSDVECSLKLLIKMHIRFCAQRSHSSFADDKAPGDYSSFTDDKTPGDLTPSIYALNVLKSKIICST